MLYKSLPRNSFKASLVITTTWVESLFCRSQLQVVHVLVLGHFLRVEYELFGLLHAL